MDIARRDRVMATKKGRRVGEEVTYFFLLKCNEKTLKQSTAQHEKGEREISRFVKAEGGRCELYSTHGGPYYAVSIVNDVSPAAAVRIAIKIESGGMVTAEMLLGARISKDDTTRATSMFSA
jgi:uncharacterized protein with GYD domain